MKYCQQCGEQCEDSNAFCMNCGAPLESADESSANQQSENQSTFQPTPSPVQGYTYAYGQTAEPNCGSGAGIAPRSIPLAVILSIVTCGLYGIYWMIKLNDEINQLAGEPEATTGIVVWLLCMVTCGIYSFYWMYKMGERTDKIKGINGNTGVMYMVITFLGFGIINYCLIQDTINKSV